MCFNNYWYLSITGLGVKLTSFIISASGNNIWPALLLTGLACLVLGMEVPTTAAYVICVSVAGPALVDMGLELLQVHLFVFWFALLSTITPPVCGTVFIAAGMVSENWLKVSITSMSLGIGLYFIPLAMIANKCGWDSKFVPDEERFVNLHNLHNTNLVFHPTLHLLCYIHYATCT